MPRSLRRGGGRVEYLEDASPLLRELGSRLGMGVEVGEVGDDDWHGQGYRQDTHQGTQRTDHHSLQPNKLSFIHKLTRTVRGTMSPKPTVEIVMRLLK